MDAGTQLRDGRQQDSLGGRILVRSGRGRRHEIFIGGGRVRRHPIPPTPKIIGDARASSAPLRNFDWWATFTTIHIQWRSQDFPKGKLLLPWRPKVPTPYQNLRTHRIWPTIFLGGVKITNNKKMNKRLELGTHHRPEGPIRA